MLNLMRIKEKVLVCNFRGMKGKIIEKGHRGEICELKWTWPDSPLSNIKSGSFFFLPQTTDYFRQCDFKKNEKTLKGRYCDRWIFELSESNQGPSQTRCREIEQQINYFSAEVIPKKTCLKAERVKLFSFFTIG